LCDERVVAQGSLLTEFLVTPAHDATNISSRRGGDLQFELGAPRHAPAQPSVQPMFARGAGA
jgi:hypothetical protein